MELSVRDVARLLNVSEDTVIRWAKSGRLAAHRFDDEYRFNTVELQECASALNRPLPPDLFKAEFSSLPRLSEALALGGVYLRVPGGTRDEVLHAVAQLPGIPPKVDRSLLGDLLVARETLASTGVGDGIAIPHPRDPLVVRIEAPTALLAYLDQAVDFEAIDGAPVKVVFLLLSPSVRAHLQLLSALSFALHDSEFRSLVRARAELPGLLARARALESAPAPDHRR
jgi:PTS system nitrogen regulatory IIA component